MGFGVAFVSVHKSNTQHKGKFMIQDVSDEPFTKFTTVKLPCATDQSNVRTHVQVTRGVLDLICIEIEKEIN